MKPETAQAVEFLSALYPKGIWALTAIDPLKKQQIETRSFTNQEDLAKWIDKYNGKRNIYFHVNQPKELISKKATKDVMGAAYFFHVDIDPRAGEDVEAEQERIERLVEEWPYDLPKPHIVLFSGGGYQLFWRLEEKFEIGGSVELCEEFERYNRTIEQVLDADNCHNVDRIMRVPGTMNIPDETKMKKGRKPTLARLVSITDGTVPMDSVTPAPKKQDAGSGLGGATKRVQISGNVERIDDLEDLNIYGIPDYLKVVIAQGSLPPEDCNEKQAKFSRSDWLFKVLCDFVRYEVPDDVAFAIVTDPAWPISEHVFAQKVPADKYAIRQIERAHDFAVDPMLEQFNKRYAVIKNLGGKCRIVEELEDEVTGRAALSKIAPHDFNLAWANRVVQIGTDEKKGTPIHKPAGKWWFEHPLRREFDRLVFSPGREIPNAYNLWQGFTVDPAPGDCSLLLAHIKDNICSGNEGHYEYLLGWLARTVQSPEKSGQSAIILRGKQGTGKSFFVKRFGELFGRHFLQVADAKHLVGSFNNHLRDCVVLFGDEAFYAGDRKHESVLKTLVTEETLHYEAKGVDSEQGRNYVHLLMASNSDWVVPADMDDRRFLVLDVSKEHAKDSEYFGAIKEQYDNGGKEAFLLFLLQYDLKGFQVRNVPKTAALVDQKLLSLEPIEEWWFKKLATGQLLKDEEHPWDKPIVKTTLVDDYLGHAKDFGISRRGSEIMIGQFLNKMCPGIYPRTNKLLVKVRIPTPDGFEVEQQKRLYHYVFPPLQECRAQWDDLLQTETTWDVIEPHQEELPEDQTPF